MDQGAATDFRAGGGGTSALMRDHAWASTLLGAPATWPQPLKTLVDVMMAAGQPMFVAWGPERTLLYNDAYAPLLGRKHPAAFGRPFFDVWAEARHDLAPLFDRVFAGEPVHMDDIALVLDRRGRPEEAHFAFSYTPVRDGRGAIAGLFCACTETTKQVIAERRLRESEDNYRHAVDLSPQTVWTAHPDGQLDHVGPRWREWTGTGGLGSDWGEAIHPDDLAPSVAAWTRSVATGEPYDIEHRVRMRDGTHRWMRSRAHPRRDGAGGIARWYGTTEDIHAARVSEEERREGEARLRGVLEGMAEGFALLDRDFRIREINAEGLRLDNRPREAIVGKTHWEAYPGSEEGELGALYKRAMAERVPVSLEHRHVWQDGRDAWLEMRAYPTDGGLAAFYRDVTERKRAERARRENETRFGAALAIAELGTFDWNVRNDVVVLDGRSRDIFGFAPGEGTRAQEVFGRIDPFDFDRVSAEARASREGLSRLETEYRINLPGGAVRTVASISDAIPGADGKAERMFGVFADITARKRAEARRLALVELGDRFRDLEDPTELSFAAAEILGRTLGVSRAGYGTIDTAAETISIGRDWNAPGIRSLAGTLRFRDYGSYIEDLKRGETVVFADAEKDPRTAATAGALKAISAQSVVNMPVTEHGGFVALLYLNHATAREWPADELAFVREVAERTRTAVERRRAEAELRELNSTLERRVEERTRELADSEARFHAYFRASPEHLFLARVSPAGGMVFQDLNPAAEGLYGLPRAEVVGRAPAEILDPATAADAESRARECLRLRRPVRYEAERRFASGRALVLSVVAAPLLVPEAGDSLVLFCGRDVTEQRRAEEQLRQSQKMEAVGQLTGGLAHDFNNLLTGITGSLDLLNTRLSQGRTKDVDRYITAAQGAAKRAAALTHRLLAFSRRQTLAPKPTDVNRLVSGMEELVRRTVGPAVAVEVVAAGGLWTTLVDPNQLENALLNLCINARDAMPDGGRLTVETGNKWLDARAAAGRDLPPGQYVSLCVSDTGTGMSPEVARRAFDPFFTTKPIGLGTGLGLSMIYGFVRQSGGQARIYSEPGQGTMVCLYLPRHLGDAEDADEPAEPAAAPRAGRGETVLVVDDEPTVRMLVAEVLEDLGYTAIEAADGAAGLKALRSGARVDLLITDVGLPGGMNGRQVADAARGLRPGLKVLFITGYTENAVFSQGHLEPGMHVLTKPFAMEALASRIKDLIAGA